MSTAEPPSTVYEPEMRVTRYDSVRALLIALLIGFAISSAVAASLYAMLRPRPPKDYIPIEIADADGGFEDGKEQETPDVQNDAPPRPDAAPVEIETEIQELQETLDVLTDLSTEAVQMLPEQVGDAADNAGELGSSDGNGSRPLGVGGGSGGVPRAKRWLIRFAANASVAEYAKQLDFFGIELGIITPEGQLVYASNLSAAKPTTRTVSSGDDEKRLYFQWEGGPRRIADRQLFSKAGLTAGNSPILHFYSKGTEGRLAQLEFQASDGIDVKKIRRTFFDVVPAGTKGYQFKVDNVVLFR